MSGPDNGHHSVKSTPSSHADSGRLSTSDRKSASRDSSMDTRKSRDRRERKKDKYDKMTIEHSDKDALEKKVEELTRQLAEEKQSSRRSIAKLQREVARLKSERNYAQRGESREGLMKELERERMLRVDAEQRLLEMRVESDSCRSRLHALQEEFKKMEEMVRNMLQYKSKIDQLKQEKSNLSITYETNLQKYSSHISTLERENMVLLNEVKKLEAQLSGKGDDQDKSKLLLQRLKMLEAENSSLVLENEQQRHQYEKCLDEIANQVVQALLAQKTLREECMKLQGRVQDLELQNRQLNVMFQQKIRCASDSVQSVPPRKHLAPAQAAEATKSNTSPVSITAIVHPQSHQPRHITQTALPQAGAAGAAGAQPGGKGEATPSTLERSTGSLQSMCSEYMFDDSPGMPQMSSPPPWLRDKLDLPLTDESRPSSSDNSPVTPPTPSHIESIAKASSSPALQTKIETEFPVNNSSPKVKRVTGLERGCQSLDRIGVARKSTSIKNTNRPHRKPKSLGKKSSSEKNVTAGGVAEKAQVLPPPSPRTKSRIPSRVPTPLISQGARKGSGDHTPEQKGQGPKHSTPQSFHDLMSQRKKALSLDNSPKSMNTSRQSSDSPRHTLPFCSQYYYDYSDEDSDSRPVSRDSSTASTVSLNDLLDSSLDMDNPLDEDFLSDWSPNCLSPNSLNTPASGPSQIPVMTKGMFYHYANPKQSSPKTVKSRPYTDIIVKDGSATVVKSEDGLSGCKPLRPDNLILVPREKQFSCGFSSSSSSSTEENKSLINSVKRNLSTEAKKEISEQNSEKGGNPQKVEKHDSTVKKYHPGVPGDNKNCIVANVSVVVSPPGKCKKSPPPVPQKPLRLRKLSSEGQCQGRTDKKGNGLIMDKDGMPFLSENLTVEKQKDLAAFLVQDVIERVKSREVLAYHQKVPSSDSSFESVRVERSGSKDDGYSTMSSDIQPEILEKFSDAATPKVEIQIKCEQINESDISSTAESSTIKTKDAFTDVMSDHDSAMETSTHSMELRNSNQSLSSQVSSSSCESAVSPVLKVNDMKKFFEEEAKKLKGAKQLDSSRSPIISPKSPKKRWPFDKDKHAKSPNSSKSMQQALEVNGSARVKDPAQDDGSVPAADIIFQNFTSVKDNSICDHTLSLHISEDKLLEDIPEDDEWEVIHNKTVQESVALQKNTLKSHLQNSLESMPIKPQSFTQKLPCLPPLDSRKNTSTKPSSLCLIKAKSDSNLSNAGQSKSTSLYEDFTQGTWDSGKVPERSASVSEMDFQPAPSAGSNSDYKRQVVQIDIDETSVLYRVHDIVKDHCQSKMSPALVSDTDSDSEAQINFIELLKQKSERPFTLPPWTPKHTMDELKKSSTPSPVSVKKFDSSNAEDWILKFSKDEIEKHINGASSQNGSAEDVSLDNICSNLSSADANVSNSSTVAQDGSFIAAESANGTHEGAPIDDSPRSPPSEEQTKFNSNFYSLCNMGSNRSLFSNGSHDQGINKLCPPELERPRVRKTAGEENIESKEFEEISKQIANLSKTVNDLHKSLSSLNSADSGSTNELPGCPPPANQTIAQPTTALDGYHWVDDEFYMASCGGEVIIGSTELLTEESTNWMDDFGDNDGARCDLDTNCVIREEEFYEIQVNGTSYTDLPGYTYSENGVGSTRVYQSNKSCNEDQSRPPRRQLSDSHMADPEKRADILDSMLASGGESNDSLASDIGLDHMMCQRLIGRRRQARHEVVRYPSTHRPPLDFSKFFIRYGEPERQAVAAFDFLEDLSTSNSESGSLPRLTALDNVEGNNESSEHSRRNRGLQVNMNSVHGQSLEGHRLENQRIITTASGRVRRVDKNKRKKRGDAMKARKQRENNSRIGMGQACRADSPQLQDSSDAVVSAGNLSLSDSCCEGFSNQ
ncbi:serine-rich adhesin for platelets-like isoform X2 [Haliotis asinina]|uniref:serine-rich adhesin for platelets-like isoform X2 n=1 Tax=Haliotis asinina TaxID=109174 RepID=UPI00353247B8